MGPPLLAIRCTGLRGRSVYGEALKKVEESGDDCIMALRWVEKGKRRDLRVMTTLGDGFHPMLLMVEGVCYINQERYEQAYAQLNLARVELRKVADQDMSDAFKQIDYYLGLVEEHVISKGDYVTNKGMLQQWIGKIYSRQGGCPGCVHNLCQ